MEHVTRFKPFVRIDPAFARKLREAASKGVMIRAYKCRVRPEEIVLAEELPVDLDAEAVDKGGRVSGAPGVVRCRTVALSQGWLENDRTCDFPLASGTFWVYDNITVF